MATIQDLKDAISQAAADATNEKAEVAAALAALAGLITALKDQIAVGITEGDLDTLLEGIQGVSVQVRDITVPATPPATP